MSTPPGGPSPYGVPGGAGADPRLAGAYGPPAGAYGPPAGGYPSQGHGPGGGRPDVAGRSPQGGSQSPQGGGWVPRGADAYRKPEPARLSHFDAAPRRSRFGLLAQFVLQFLYIPVWALIAAALLVVVLVLDADSNANVGLPGGMFGFVKTGISWRRMRAEWSGRAESWAPFTDARLAEAFAKAEKDSGWSVTELPPSGVRKARCELPVRHYRGLDSTGLGRLAEQRGWSLDRDATKSPAETAHFFRLIPPPPHVGVPDPYAPAPRPGAPWGPLPRRFAMPLLTFVFMPRLRALELRGSADAYLAHLRTYLPRQISSENAKSPGKGYLTDGSGGILRRVEVRIWHYRGAGAHAVLRVAAEQGWRIDHSFPARPDGPVHLCSPDTFLGAAAQDQAR